jgi:hypothetical protein
LHLQAFFFYIKLKFTSIIGFNQIVDLFLKSKESNSFNVILKGLKSDSLFSNVFCIFSKFSS